MVDWTVPLAERMRPQQLSEISGQNHLLGAGKPLQSALNGETLHSMIFWGPPGTGKTTFAKLMALQCKANFLTLSAVTSGIQDIRKAIQQASELNQNGEQTLLFVDEVHRFNKVQQDAFLPHIEDGTIVFIGATTENPSFELNNALLSRTRVYLLKTLDEVAIREIILRALSDAERGLGSKKLNIDDDALDILIAAGGGDARQVLGYIETAADLVDVEVSHNITQDIIEQVVSGKVLRFDKQGDYYYDQISALQKSIRGSNPDAAIYWANRMLKGGCDPHYILRRSVHIASEDIGNADPRALTLALDAWNAFDRLGSPEGDLAISHAACYLAVAAKSNAVYTAHNQVQSIIERSPIAEVPIHLRNAPTRLAKSLGHGAEYRYSHSEPNHFSAGQTYLPDELVGEQYYFPTENGLEKRIGEKLQYLQELDAKESRS